MESNETTQNFWRAWNSFQWPDPKPVSYRCYYRDDGTVDFYTMDDLPGSYVEVSKEIYIASPYNARVEKGVFRLIPRRHSVERLVPDQSAGIRCDRRDVCVIVSDSHEGTYWDIQKNEID